MASFASSATTTVANIQSLGQFSMVTLANSLAEMRRLLGDQTKGVLFEDFEPPEKEKQDKSKWSADDYSKSIVEALKGFEDDVKAIDASIGDAATKFTDVFQGIERTIFGLSEDGDVAAGRVGAASPSGIDTTLPVGSARVVEGAAAASVAFNTRLKQQRREAEVEAFERAAGSKFYRIPGHTLSDILAVREKTLEQAGEYAAKVLVAEQRMNAQLYTQWAVSSYSAAVGIAVQFANFSIATMQLMASLIADYDSSLESDKAKRTQAKVSLEAKLRGESVKLSSKLQENAADNYWFNALREKEVDLYLERFKATIYKIETDLFKKEDAAIAGMLASALRDAGTVASRATAAIGASGSFTERGFS